jgi:PKD repeat protein
MRKKKEGKLMSRMKGLYIQFLIAIICVTSLISSSFAFDYSGVKWPDSDIPVGYYVNENTNDTTGEGLACQAAAQAWSDVSTSSFEFQYLGPTTRQGYGYNGYNDLSWGSTGGSIATTYIWYIGGTIVECDMVFEDSFNWGTNGASNLMDVQNIATHEFGHYLLLLDLYDGADGYKTMYGYGSTGETKKRTLDPDDIAGISFIYPAVVGGGTVTADFTADPTSGYAPHTVQFTDLSDGSISGWLWDFGDGTPISTEQNPSHTYTSTGSYTVTLEVSGVDSSDTVTKSNYVNVAVINADFTASPESGYAPLSVQFIDSSTGDISGWLWDFGDGTPISTEQNPSHTYNNSGSYTVTLEVSGVYGSDTVTKANYINATVINADFTASPESGYAPLSVQFTDSSTGDISGWLWDFGDGTPISTGQNPSHTYNSAGSYTVTMEVSGVYGSDTVTKANYVNVTVINADFTASPRNGNTPLTVQFTDLSDGSISGWLWDFGDGTPISTGQNPSHTYNSSGSYTVTLEVSGIDGSDTVTKSNYINVTVINADFTASSPRSGYTPHTVQFADLSDGSISGWLWDFGDGTPTSTEQNPSHTYNSSGSYTVTLEVSGVYGSDTVTKYNYINVTTMNADFTASPRSGYAPLTVQFTDLSDGSISGWLWDFGDGTPISTEQNPSHTYNSSGSYTVTLEVSGAYGSDTVTKSNYINVTAIYAAFTAGPRSGYAPLTVEFTDLSAGNISGWLWDFGDGSPMSTEQYPSHTYTSSGSYTVTLEVSGIDGSDTATKANYINVGAMNANFTASKRRGNAPLNVQFTDLSDGSISGWLWDFGDGTPMSTDQNPSHTYTSKGRYTVTLKVTGADGSDTITKANYIRVRRAARQPRIKPVIAMVSPDDGFTGSQVAIYGSGFGGEQGQGFVLFPRKKVATIVYWSDDMIECIIPEGTRKGYLKLKNKYRSRSNKVYFTLTE